VAHATHTYDPAQPIRDRPDAFRTATGVHAAAIIKAIRSTTNARHSVYTACLAPVRARQVMKFAR